MLKICHVESNGSYNNACLFTGTDPEDTLRNAFAMFDAEHTGFIPEE